MQNIRRDNWIQSCSHNSNLQHFFSSAATDWRLKSWSVHALLHCSWVERLHCPLVVKRWNSCCKCSFQQDFHEPHKSCYVMWFLAHGRHELGETRERFLFIRVLLYLGAARLTAGFANAEGPATWPPEGTLWGRSTGRLWEARNRLIHSILISPDSLRKLITVWCLYVKVGVSNIGPVSALQRLQWGPVFCSSIFITFKAFPIDKDPPPLPSTPHQSTRIFSLN